MVLRTVRKYGKTEVTSNVNYNYDKDNKKMFNPKNVFSEKI